MLWYGRKKDEAGLWPVGEGIEGRERRGSSVNDLRRLSVPVRPFGGRGVRGLGQMRCGLIT